MLRSRIPEIIRDLDRAMGVTALAGANAVAQTAKELVPVETGRLRTAIHVERDSDGGYAVIAGDHDAWYGHLVEHGTTHSAPHPFLIPALEMHRAETVMTGMKLVRRAVNGNGVGER